MLFFPIFVQLFTVVKASHFRGGSISWRPVQTNQNSVLVEFYAKWTWRLTSVGGPGTGGLVSPGGQINCLIGCSSSLIGDTSFYETSRSKVQDWISGEKKWNISLPKTSLIRASFSSCCWISLITGGSSNEVGVMLNTITRHDTGRINSSPISLIPSLLTLIYGSNMTLAIPIKDEDNDVIRCRWSNKSNNECGDICGQSVIVTLDSKNCIMIIDSRNRLIGWYAASITIEDFANHQSTVPLSSVVAQFLISVISLPTGCSIKPSISIVKQNQLNFNALVGKELRVTVQILMGCKNTYVTERQLTGPKGMYYSSLRSINTSVYETDIVWTPFLIGTHLVLFYIIDSNQIESNLISLKIDVTNSTESSTNTVFSSPLQNTTFTSKSTESSTNTMFSSPLQNTTFTSKSTSTIYPSTTNPINFGYEWYTIQCFLSKSRRLKNGTIEIKIQKISFNHMCDILDSDRKIDSLKTDINKENKSINLTSGFFQIIHNYLQYDNDIVHISFAYIAISICVFFAFLIIINDVITLSKHFVKRRSKIKKVFPLK